MQKIELSYELTRSYEGHKDLDDAARVIAQVHEENPKLLGVVRATADYYWRNKQSAKAIDTLLEAAKTAKPVQPALSRQLVVEAANKANASGSYTQARALMAPLVDPQASNGDAYNAQYLAVIADSYARAGDDAGLKQFYLDKLAAIRSASMSGDERKQQTVLLRRGLIPALTRMKDYAGAIEQYIAILSAYPEDTNTAQEASLYALRWGRQQQLVDFAANTVKASPRDSRFAILLGQIQTTFEDYPAAVDAYARAISIRSDLSDLYAAKADQEERLQRLDDACKDYARLYELSYRNPDWMVKIASVRARQGRNDEAVKALQRAWIEGHPATAHDYFRVATQLESWKMLDQSLRFAELGVKAEGNALLAGSEPGERNADDPEGAAIYARLLTRTRQPQKALDVLDGARAESDQSPNSPAVVVEQVEKQGLASVTNEEWRKHRIEERRKTTEERYKHALEELGKTAGAYFTPEEKQQFAALIDKRASKPDETLLWIDVAGNAGLGEEEARLLKQVLLHPGNLDDAQIKERYEQYVQLERSRLAYTEMAQTIDAYAQQADSGERDALLAEEARAYRSEGDEVAELHVLERIGFEQKNDGGDLQRYLELLLRHDPARFEAFGASSDDAEIALAAPNYAVVHSDPKVTRATLSSRAQAFPGVWAKAYSALTGLYFRDRSATTESAFHGILGDGQTVGERIRIPTKSSVEDDASPQLTGGIWFYYGMRYGVYRTLAPEKQWPQNDPEDFLAAALERNASPGNYAVLARAYAEAAKPTAALAEYRHALELAPDSAAVYDAMALLLWKDGRKDDAVAVWRSGLTALNRIQNKGSAPESFWSGFALIAQHVGSRKLTSQLHPEMDVLLRSYLGHNGNYRSNELLQKAFLASASASEGVEWMLSLSTAASDPESILAGIDSAAWLPEEAREPLLLRELELARIAANHGEEGNEYASGRLSQLEQRLTLYYVAQKQDAKAEAMLDGLSEEQRNDGEIFSAQVDLAVRGHRLNALLAGLEEDSTANIPAPLLQMLRNAAAMIAREGDKANALVLWEFVFERSQLQHDLMTSDYMGLAEARLDSGNLAGAMEILRRLTLALASDQVEQGSTTEEINAESTDASGGMSGYDLAATLLVEKGHPGEAIEFLKALTAAAPWNGSYRLRLAEAQLRAGQSKTDAVAALTELASDNNASYSLRVRAAVAMQGELEPSGKSLSYGSGELQLLATGKMTLQQTQQPYFAGARIAFASSLTDTAGQASLLQQAVAISPDGLEGAGEFADGEVRLALFRAEASAGHDAKALDIMQPLLRDGNSASDQDAADETDASVEETAEDGQASAGSEADASSEEAPSPPSVTAGAASETQGALEAHAPLPGSVNQSGGEKLAVALLVAQVYEHTGSPAVALPYLKLAAYLQKDPTAHAELQHRIEQLNTALALAAQNARRRPVIQKSLDQSGIVRPMLDAVQLAQQEAQ